MTTAGHGVTAGRGALDGEALEARVRRWVEGGIITPEQAHRILVMEATEVEASKAGLGPVTTGTTEPTQEAVPAAVALPRSVTAAPSGSLVTEALGYVGGVLILIATLVIGGLYFDDLGRVGRLAVTLAAAAALLAGGFLVPVAPHRPAAGRLRSVLWVLTVVAFAAFLGLLGDQVFRLTGERVGFVAASGAALVGAELWRRHRWLPQQAAFVTALAVAVGSGTAAFLGDGGSDATGLALWGLGGVWLMLGWGRHLTPRYGTDLLGGIILTIGSEVTMEHDWGSVLAVVTAAVLVLAGVRLRSLVLLAVGSMATLSTVPGLMQRYFPDTVAAPLALLGVGILLVLVASTTATKWGRRRGERHEPAPLPGLGLPTIAGFAAVVAGAAVLVAVT